jgi:hypothetical protein
MAESKVEKIAVEEETARAGSGGLPRLARSAMRAGMSLALLPVALLPAPTQKHVRRAGSELTLGVAALLRATSEALDDVADEMK